MNTQQRLISMMKPPAQEVKVQLLFLASNQYSQSTAYHAVNTLKVNFTKPQPQGGLFLPWK